MLRASQLPAEMEEGNKEYKYKLTSLSHQQLTHRITQLHWRLNEGKDLAVYEIGVTDDGYPLGISDEEMAESLENLQVMADAVGCSMTIKHRRMGELGTTVQVIMQRREKLTLNPCHVHVAVCGEVDAGKSTLISVLSSGSLDNGNGLARNHIVRHNHEIETGRTSSITHHAISFSDSGEVLNSSSKSNRLRGLSDMEIAEKTHRIVVFADLAGHEKYFKTTLHGFLGREPDVCMLAINARRGIASMTRELLGVAVALKVPLMIVVTKVDMATEKAVSTILKDVNSLLLAAGRKSIMMQEGEVPILSASGCIRDILSVPIFQVSNVSGAGLHKLKSYLFHLPSHQKQWDLLKLQSVEIRVLEQYRVDSDNLDDDEDGCASPFELPTERVRQSRNFERGVSSAVIVLGMIKTGSVSVADTLLYGPDKLGTFMAVVVSSIQINRVPVTRAVAGQCATLLVRKSTKDCCSDFEESVFESTLTSRAASSDMLSSTPTPQVLPIEVLSIPLPKGLHVGRSKTSMNLEDDDWTEEDNSELNEIWEKRVGMVLVSPLTSPTACWVFTAELVRHLNLHSAIHMRLNLVYSWC
jgi:GTPase